MKKKWIVYIAVLCLVMGLYPAKYADAAKHPAKYRNENVTSVKNQYSQGLCWAFACTSAMEAELIQNNGVDKSVDFSELHMAYFSRNSAMDELGQMNLMFSGTHDFLDGASSNFFATTLAAGVSPVGENDIPFAYEDATDGATLDESLAYTGAYYVNEVKLMREPSRDEIKDAIKRYGAVVADYDGMSNSNFNETTFGWYNPNSEYVNHSVCIVGWDDNFSKKNFNTTPKGNGAWIVKNSWGEEWGDEGYFYLSYYDTSVAIGTFAVFDMEIGKSSDHIYQNAFEAIEYFSFNESGEAYTFNGANGYSKVANVFTASANDKGGELLKSVGFYTFVESDYVIKIYKNVKESNRPESGTLAATLTGKIDAPGFKMIPITNPIYLSEGESYAIVVEATDTNGAYAGVATSGCYDRTPTYGQSYVTYDGKIWCDYAVSMGENLFINAYTDDVEKNTEADKKKVTMVTISPDIDSLNAPENVTGVKVSHTESNAVTLSWTKKSNANYIVFQYNAKAKTWKKIAFVNRNYYRITGLKAGTSYTFAVKEVAKGTPLSTSATVYLQSTEYAKVTAKTGSAQQITPDVKVWKTGNTIKWTNVSGANKYEVYVLSPTTDYVWKKLKTVKAGETLKCNDKNVAYGLSYMYRVYSYKDNKLLSRGVPVSVTFE